MGGVDLQSQMSSNTSLPTRCSEDNETCFACVVAHQGLSVMWTNARSYARSRREGFPYDRDASMTGRVAELPYWRRRVTWREMSHDPARLPKYPCIHRADFHPSD